ncbi:MAG: hypothetical protein DMG30_15535 [Acidobacteria bacterium]|nr:MAG: hypothetical protein DMG30_15535 [Acidobacteriota bacterium]
MCAVEAKDGKEAIEKVKALNPDLVLLEINMPVMNGMQAALEIRRISPRDRRSRYRRSLACRWIHSEIGRRKGIDSCTGAPSSIFPQSVTGTITASNCLAFEWENSADRWNQVLACC